MEQSVNTILETFHMQVESSIIPVIRSHMKYPPSMTTFLVHEKANFICTSKNPAIQELERDERNALSHLYAVSLLSRLSCGP